MQGREHMAKQRFIDLDMNETLRIQEGAEGPFLLLWPLGSGPHFDNYYPVVISELSDGKWRAQVPLMPQCDVSAATREEAKEALAGAIRDYLRKRVGFIHDAAPLVQQYITENGHDADANSASIEPYHLPVWRLIGEMGDAFSASSVGDDSLMIDPKRITDAADRLHVPSDAARAAVAYYLEHKQAIRSRIAEDRHARLDAAFEHLSDADKLDAENLDRVLGSASDDGH